MGARPRRLPRQGRRQRIIDLLFARRRSCCRPDPAGGLRSAEPGRPRRNHFACGGRRGAPSSRRSSSGPCSRCCSNSTARWRRRPRRLAPSRSRSSGGSSFPPAPGDASGAAPAEGGRRVRLDHPHPGTSPSIPKSPRSGSSSRSRATSRGRPRRCPSCCSSSFVVLAVADVLERRSRRHDA